METKFDIIIIGAGLVGLTTALACAESGVRVAILDRHAITAGRDGRAKVHGGFISAAQTRIAI